MWLAVVNFFGKILPFFEKLALSVWGFFTGTLLEQLKIAQEKDRLRENARKNKAHSDALPSDDKRDRLQSLSDSEQ